MHSAPRSLHALSPAGLLRTRCTTRTRPHAALRHACGRLAPRLAHRTRPTWQCARRATGRVSCARGYSARAGQTRGAHAPLPVGRLRQLGTRVHAGKAVDARALPQPTAQLSALLQGAPPLVERGSREERVGLTHTAVVEL